jgi:hypothetical protein
LPSAVDVPKFAVDVPEVVADFLQVAEADDVPKVAADDP